MSRREQHRAVEEGCGQPVLADTHKVSQRPFPSSFSWAIYLAYLRSKHLPSDVPISLLGLSLVVGWVKLPISAGKSIDILHHIEAHGEWWDNQGPARAKGTGLQVRQGSIIHHSQQLSIKLHQPAYKEQMKETCQA